MNNTWEQLEAAFRSFRDLQKQYYCSRYAYFKLISKAKREANRSDLIDWKSFERACRAATKRWKRQQKRPRGKVCDHKVSIFKAYYLGWSVSATCDPSNLQWISKKENLDKGVI